MSTSLISTETGVRAWICRWIELRSINATLRWAESDRAFLAAQLDIGPKRLRQMERDLEQLRVRQAILRSGLEPPLPRYRFDGFGWLSAGFALILISLGIVSFLRLIL